MVSDEEREAKMLRTIVVSTRAALLKTSGSQAERVRDRSDELLADLESLVIRDGGSETIIAAIDRERRALQERE
jgi:hypothetical protein